MSLEGIAIDSKYETIQQLAFHRPSVFTWLTPFKGWIEEISRKSLQDEHGRMANSCSVLQPLNVGLSINLIIIVLLM